MEDAQQAPRALGGGRSGARAEEPRALAERLFAGLTEHAESTRNGNGTPRMPSDDRDVVPGAELTPIGQPTPSAATEPRPEVDREVRDLVLAALAATDSISEVVQVVGAQVDAGAADLALLGQAIEEALQATNDRLAALERALPLAVPDESALAADHAMARLRTALRRSASGSGS